VLRHRLKLAVERLELFLVRLQLFILHELLLLGNDTRGDT
jgi:hypothetical protein